MMETMAVAFIVRQFGRPGFNYGAKIEYRTCERARFDCQADNTRNEVVRSLNRAAIPRLQLNS